MTQDTPDLASALDVLASRGWLAKRPKAVRAQLAKLAKLRILAKNELIYHLGDPPNGIFGLVKGSLNISFPRGDGEDYTLHRAGAGFWIGDLALLSNAPRLVSVRAAEHTVMVHVPAHDLLRLVRDEPRLYADFYTLTYENVQIALRLIANLAISGTDKRLADRLIMEVELRGDSDGWIHLSQPELAKLLAVSLPTLQRVMRRFVGNGILASRYGRIRVLDAVALARFCIEPSNQRARRKP